MPEPAPPPPDPGQLRKLREEQAKLSAAWINNVAAATFVIGALQPVVAGSVTRWSIVFILLSVVLHIIARAILERQFPIGVTDAERRRNAGSSRRDPDGGGRRCFSVKAF